MIIRMSHPTSLYRVLSALLLLLLLLTGCPPSTTTTPSEPLVPPVSIPGEGARALDKAQKLFNEAGGLDQPSTEIPAPSLQKYQQVVAIVEQEVLGKVDKPLEVTAYALLAFSRWRLGDYNKAMEAGNLGRQLYESQNLTTNPRAYGMCLIVGGLCLATQTYKEYENLLTAPTKELRQNLTGRLQRAMQDIDLINSRLGRSEDIVVYANQWQLALADAAMRIWTAEGLAREVWQPEVCNWLARAQPLFAKFPDGPYKNQAFTLTYKNKFDRRKKEYCPGP